jgi:hypothetical protein
MKPKIYVAAAYTASTPVLIEANVALAISQANELLELGCIPFCPHLYHYWNQHHPHDYDTWMRLCLAWVESCDGLLLLSNTSPGAFKEANHAQSLQIPVFSSVSEISLRFFFNPRK